MTHSIIRTDLSKNLLQLFHLKHPAIITLTGAGGKTTLLYTLSSLLSEQNNTTLVTTTTHILPPDHIPVVTSERMDLIREAFLKNYEIALGIPVQQKSDTALTDTISKWKSPDLSFLKAVSVIPDYIVCEGDGSKRMPLKIPRTNEPVLYPGTSIVIGIIGLSALNQNVSGYIFGWKEGKEHFSQQNIVDLSLLEEIALSSYGLKKGVSTEEYHIVFNQADLLSDHDLKKVCTLASQISSKGTPCHVMSLKNNTLFTLEQTQ